MNFSLTIKVSEDKIIIFHYDKGSDIIKKDEKDKNQEIVDLLKKSFVLERKYFFKKNESELFFC